MTSIAWNVVLHEAHSIIGLAGLSIHAVVNDYSGELQSRLLWGLKMVKRIHRDQDQAAEDAFEAWALEMRRWAETFRAEAA